MPRTMMTAKGMAMRKAKSHETVESKPVPSKPYDRPNIEETKPSDNEEEKEVKPIEPKPGKASGKSEYNKLHLVALIIKDSAPDWEKVASHVGKTPIQCRDTWRKTISPALLDGRDWSNSGPGWDHGMKVAALLEVVRTSKPDWAVLGNIMGGKTATQVKDVWRKVILPRLKKGMTIE